MNNRPNIIEYDNMCKAHSARTEKDHHRICPSKLSKKELEDIYFTLIDNNLQLKKTTNAQQEQIKILTTKMNRITALKSIYGSQNNCCKEQKEVISDLKQANEKLVERVRLLNMRLCSAKQFLKRSPLQITRCQNCLNIRNSSTITLNGKKSQTNLRMRSTSSQYLDKDITPLILVESYKDPVPEQKECTQNKCKTTIEELKQSVSNIQKELSKAQENCSKISELEAQVSSLKHDNLRVRTLARVSEDNVHAHKTHVQQLLKKIRELEADHTNISMELTLGRQKVRELETQLRMMEISQSVTLSRGDDGTMRHDVISKENQDTCEKIVTPSKVDQSDDSGYLETHHKDDTTHKVFIERIEDLQSQINAMKSIMECGAGDNMIIADISKDQTFKNIESHVENETENNISTNSKYKTKNRKQKNKNHNRLDSLDRSKSIDEVHENTVSKDSDIHNYETRSNSNNILKKADTDEYIQSEFNDYGLIVFEKEKVENQKNNFALIDSGSENNRKTKLNKDIGIQSAEDKRYVSRAVGCGVVDDATTTDAAVQIGASLCENAIDTKTYSRESARSRTYIEDQPKRGIGDNTEAEISSLSDLPTERDSNPSDYISPGEERMSSSLSEAYGTSDELSEGELPTAGNIRSYGEVIIDGNSNEQIRPISPSLKVEQAIKAVKEELTRCNQLLEGASLDPSAFTVYRDGRVKRTF